MLRRALILPDPAHAAPTSASAWRCADGRAIGGAGEVFAFGRGNHGQLGVLLPDAAPGAPAGAPPAAGASGGGGEPGAPVVAPPGAMHVARPDAGGAAGGGGGGGARRRSQSLSSTPIDRRSYGGGAYPEPFSAPPPREASDGGIALGDRRVALDHHDAEPRFEAGAG